MENSLSTSFYFLISTLFDLAIFVLLLRLILVGVRADFYNPVSQVVNRITQFLIKPLKKIIPNFKFIETSTLLCIFILEILKFGIIGYLFFPHTSIPGLAIIALADMLKTTLNIFFYAILIRAILSWVQASYSPIANVLNQITSPIMRPLQRIIPPIGGLDLSPLAALILLQFLTLLLVSPISSLGQSTAFGL